MPHQEQTPREEQRVDIGFGIPSFPRFAFPFRGGGNTAQAAPPQQQNPAQIIQGGGVPQLPGMPGTGAPQAGGQTAPTAPTVPPAPPTSSLLPREGSTNVRGDATIQQLLGIGTAGGLTPDVQNNVASEIFRLNQQIADLQGQADIADANENITEAARLRAEASNLQFQVQSLSQAFNEALFRQEQGQQQQVFQQFGLPEGFGALPSNLQGQVFQQQQGESQEGEMQMQEQQEAQQTLQLLTALFPGFQLPPELMEAGIPPSLFPTLVALLGRQQSPPTPSTVQFR